jgi:hypothetical protein
MPLHSVRTGKSTSRMITSGFARVPSRPADTTRCVYRSPVSKCQSTRARPVARPSHRCGDADGGGSRKHSPRRLFCGRWPNFRILDVFTCENAKDKRGYSRDSRPDCKQVVVGLALDSTTFAEEHQGWSLRVQVTGSIQGADS